MIHFLIKKEDISDDSKLNKRKYLYDNRNSYVLDQRCPIGRDLQINVFVNPDPGKAKSLDTGLDPLASDLGLDPVLFHL